FLLAAGLVIPRVRAQTALDIDFVAFLQILACNLGGARPSGNVVPLSAILPVAFLVFEALVGGQAELGHGRALRRVLHFGIFAEVADEDNFVDALSCHWDAPLEGFSIPERAGCGRRGRSYSLWKSVQGQ